MFILVASLPGVVVAASPPPTLTGEFLSAFPDAIPSSSVDIVASCDPGGSSTISWSASGDAFGPYPGTFIETGSATVGPQTAPAFVNGLQLGFLVSVEAFFTIDSPTGQVIGSKRLTSASSSDLGGCRNLDGYVLPSGGVASGTFRRVLAQSMSYEALVITSDGAYLDSGSAGTLLEHFDGTGIAEIDAVQEGLTSTQSTVIDATGGRATGGGRVGDVTFGFTAMKDKSGPKGRCAVVDVPAGAIVKCLDVLYISVADGRATIYGNAVFGETPVRYRMEVTDVTESGAGADGWTIRLSNGYAAGGILTEGNVQVGG
ncbi:MAG TPA: post-COAP-1 domain-containing protein [Candidatus Limnocylindrales bacterium]|nr:post-COAP-1 domain-containing protein [Candidatus Limnocylindrales bacterium]